VPETLPRKRVQRPNPHDPGAELKRFIGICADMRKQLDPEAIKANVGQALGNFFDGLPEDSKKLVTDVAGMIRRPR
jgi:hypothetical protein